MTHRFYTLPLLLLASVLILAGCDQSSQNPDFSSGNSYIINLEKSAVGDDDDNPFTATVPDTLDYAVQGFTIDKDYTWTVNDTELPVETRADQTYVWERREGGFISVVFSPDDPLATTDSETTSHTITVDASPDDIDPATVEVTAQYPNIATQVGRLPEFSPLASLATSSEVAGVLGGDGPFTLLGPQSSVLSPFLLPPEDPDSRPAPTQATDDDEPATSSVRGDLLKYHAIPSSVASGDISDGDTAPTLLGDQELTFNVSGGVITVNGAQVVRPGIPVTNGNFHGVDGLLTPSTASVDFTDRSKDPAPAAGDTITVDGSFFPADVDANGGGYIVLHDSTELADQGALPSIVGKSEYVNPGVQNEVAVVLDEAISDTTSLGAMAHRDSDGDMTYDFETSGGTEDGPYTLSGAPVIDYGVINPPDSN